MAFQSSGPVSFSNISKFFSGSNTTISLGDPLVRLLTKDTTGPVKISDVYSKPAAGSISFTTPGTYSFLVPVYQYLNVTLNGAGGGGGGGDNHNIYGYGNCGYDGANGGNSQFLTAIAYGGGYGGGNCSGHPGVAGGGTGGTVTVGGGAAGGNGGWPQQGSGNGYNGGAGGLVTFTWTNLLTTGYPAWNTYVTVIVGLGGAAAPQNATTGLNGSVLISWS
jgi:hypothetical protein